MSQINRIMLAINCLQIYSLEFDHNTEITAMVSAEGEVVPITKKICPNAANVIKNQILML